MNYQKERTTYGKTMFLCTFGASYVLMKHMWLYYLLAYTWGIIMTLIGWIALAFTKTFLKSKIVESGRFGPCHYVIIGNNWGGLSIGTTIFIADKMLDDYTQHTKEHECGHSFQNSVLGPLFLILVFIPSIIRYWVDYFKGLSKAYDAIWFEGGASTVGNYYYNNFLNK